MTTLSTLIDRSARGRRSLAAATLVEVMFSSAILVIVVMALMSAHLMGMRLSQLVESKAGASDSSRKALNQLPTDIRSAKRWNIGNLSGTSNFVSLADGVAQKGTALQLFPTTNFSTPYILYFFDLSDTNNSNGRLVRTVNTNWSPVVLASNLINSLYFLAEDYTGKTATNEGTSAAFKNVIHTTLDFKQFQYPLTTVGTNQLYDFYRLDFKATPHLPE